MPLREWLDRTPETWSAPTSRDLTSPFRLLFWLTRSQSRRIALGAVLGTSWMVGLAVPPWVLSRVVDDGLVADNTAALVRWALVLLAVSVLNALLAIGRHRTMTKIRMDASFRSVRATVRHTSRLGASLARRVSAGEVVTVGISDVQIVAQALTVTGPGVGAVVAYAVVAVVLFTSGAGKSTLARLLAGLDRPHTGSVTIGGTPVADLPPDLLREHVVLITQDHHVFHDTVRDNLRIARPKATDGEMRAALDAVGAAWLADLPGGLDTEVGHDINLDGAGAQQLSLARVALANPHTLILDEATAQLDPRTARRTEQSLAAVLRGRTVIAIAHRLQTAHDADRIAVMEAGELVELGTHEELVSAGRTYGKLWRTWHSGSEAP
ncbi:ATP-binding cassette domain-containing protein [Promicromonospora panici]|uniref:ATP-binding cassette domain-containing protein n=1 Tax=Promicromonospora panici TaxID=2219658 RepID=UPI001F5DC19D|nr:ABC transporter ATP-binding protein [Promicromonospora panici]